MSLDLTIAYRIQSGSRQENCCRDRDWFLQTEKWVATLCEDGRDTISFAIYFSFKIYCRNKKKSVTTSYFSEFYRDRNFNVAT